MTVWAQVDKLRGRFGLSRVVLMGDRGMLTEARIREEAKPAGLDWISALRGPALHSLVESGAVREVGSRHLHKHDILDQAVVPTGREIKQTIEGAALESTKIGSAGTLWPNAICWFQSEHIDEWKTSPSVLAEELQLEKTGKVLPDTLVLVHEVAGSDFDTLSARQRGAGITLDNTGEIALKPHECRENRGDRGCSRGLVQDDAACPWARLGGRRKNEAKKPRYALARRVFAEPSDDALEQRKALAEFADQFKAPVMSMQNFVHCSSTKPRP